MKAPAGTLTEADRAALREHRDEFLALLRDVASLKADGTAARLRELHAGLTRDEHARLAAEAAAGDVLSALVAAAVAAETEGPLMPARAVFPITTATTITDTTTTPEAGQGDLELPAKRRG